MTRTKRAAKPKAPIQALIDREANEENTRPLVNAFTEQHGDYQRNLRFVANHGSSTIGAGV